MSLHTGQEVRFVFLVQLPINQMYTHLVHRTIQYTKNYKKRIPDCQTIFSVHELTF